MHHCKQFLIMKSKFYLKYPSTIITLIILLIVKISAFAQEPSNTDAKEKQDEFEVLITYTDKTTETLRSEFYSDEVTGKPFIFKNNCERIYADQTETIIIKNYKNEVQKGISFENTWYFEVEGLTGPKLNVYNDRPYKQTTSNYFFKKGDGPFVKYANSVVKTLFTDNPEANKFAKKHLHTKTLQKSIMYVGIVAAIGGAFVVNPMLSIPVGIVISSSSVAFNNKISRNLYKAVMVYNQQW
ncbi:MAG: hypothetical protein RL060_1735 [Bacteroidota bacterium]